MIIHRQEKIENAISFIAAEYRKKTHKYISQTILYKMLGFLDFDSIQETGEPALEFTYMAMERGPVPLELYENKDKLKNDLFSFRYMGENKYVVVSKSKPDLDYFTSWEQEKMKELIEIYSNSSVTANDASDASHEGITAWKKTWEKEKNSIIDYKDPNINFEDDILNKKPEELSIAEEHYLTCLAFDDF